VLLVVVGILPLLVVAVVLVVKLCEPQLVQETSTALFTFCVFVPVVKATLVVSTVDVH